MRNTFLLIKNYFNCFLGNLFKRKNQVMKYGSAILLLLGISAIFVYLFVSLAITSTTEAIEFGNPKIALYLTASMALIFIMLMTITKSTTPFRNTDDEQLLALPVTKTNIVIAKLFYDYLEVYVKLLKSAKQRFSFSPVDWSLQHIVMYVPV